MDILLLFLIGFPVLLGIANLFHRIILGYWSSLFTWLLFGYFAILGAVIAGITIYGRALERSNEIQRQKSIARSLERLERQAYWDSFRGRSSSRINTEQILREIRR